MKTLIKLLILLLVSCAPGGEPIWEINWNFYEPVSVEIDTTDLPLDKVDSFIKETNIAFEGAITQLGGSVTLNAKQNIKVKYDKSCSCFGCNEITVAHTDDLSRDTMQICPRVYFRNDVGDAIFHELGHVCGVRQDGHLAPFGDTCPPNEAGVNIMTLYYSCRKIHNMYSDPDKEAICRPGKVRSKVCDKIKSS